MNSGIDKVVITGDFNENQLNQRSNKIRSIALQNGLFQTVSDPTYFCETSCSLLDLIMVNSEDILIYTEVSENILASNIRYHCPISGILNIEKSQNRVFRRKIWDFNRGNFTQYKEDLSNVDWNNLIAETDLNKAVQNVTNKIIETGEKNIPVKYITVRPKDPPWMCNYIRKTIRKRKRLHRKAKKSNNPDTWRKFRNIRNKCVNLIRDAKSKYMEKQASLLNSPDTPVRNWWKLLRDLSGLPSKNSSYPPLLLDDLHIEDDLDKANAFNVYFCEQANVDDRHAVLPENVFLNDIPILDTISISQQDILDVLVLLDTSKATGPDYISPKLLKNGASELCGPLAQLFNKSLQLCVFPSDWKIANVIPVYKNKGGKEFLANYRPIALLSLLAKVMGKCVFKHFFNFLTSNKLITKLQSGFMPGDSTENQLLCIANDIGKALDDGKEVRVIFCDISRAFDRVWHKGLLYKLEKIGIRGPLLAWFKSYLSNRKQKVVIGGKESELLEIKAGVPQGSILGPVLFLIYINDIINDISCSIKLFADDTSLYIVVEDEYLAAEMLNSDIEKIHNWSTKWLVNFNPGKTEAMTISKKQRKPHHPPIYMNNIMIKEVETHKHLGLNFHEDGNWNYHVEEIIKKASIRLNLLRSLKYKLKRNQLQTIYFSFIRPILEYSSAVWDNIPEFLKNQIENLQLEAARIVTGCTKLCSKSKLYEDTCWETLSERRNRHKILKFHEMFHRKSPEYLQALIPRQLNEVHNYNTRRSNNIQNIHCRTSFYQGSFLPIWNSLPETVRMNPSTGHLKNFLFAHLNKVPKYYNIGSRKEQILHARLRSNCSSLKDHLFHKNLSETNLCSCGEIENTKHFLMDCVLYTNIRQRTINTINFDLNLNLLLYGSETLSEEDNESIFKMVHCFIVDTGRLGLG